MTKMIRIKEKKLKAAIQIVLAEHNIIYTDEIEKTLVHHIKALSEQANCDCPSETFAYHYKGDGKCGYCGGKAEF